MALPWRRIQHVLAASVFAGLVVLAAFTITFYARHVFAVNRLTRGVGDTMFYSADGRPWFRMDEQRRDVPLSEIAPSLQKAVVAIEDHRFHRHPGIDPIGLARAVVSNVRSDSVQGGSTLTQQLARTLFLTNRRTWGRKFKEALLALMIESRLTKAQILELYLNRIYMGADIYGVEPMSRRLFGKPARDVTLAEAAVIIGVIRAPSALSPWANARGAIERSHVVLARMREEGFITAAEEQAARRARVRFRPFSRAAEAKAGYAKEFLRQQFRNRFGGEHPPDWKVETTFLPDAQEAAERAVESGLRRLGIPELQSALVAIDPATGDLLALVGGRSYEQSAYNRARRSRRQPGSAFKPVLYAVALERGYSPVSVLSGLAGIQPIGREEWSPRNSGGATPDRLTLREALVESNNRAAVALQQQIGARPVIALAGDLGMRELPDVPSLALGTGLVSPIELTVAYAVFPNGGLAVRPRGITRILDAEGGVALEEDVHAERVISPQAAFQMVTMLQDVVDRGTASAVRSAGLRFQVGGKTGTTDDFKDAWFVGFSTAVVAGVWVGFDQPATIAPNAYGSRMALPIWTDFMRRVSRRLRADDFAVPSGLRDEILCQQSYLRPVEGCPTYTEYFKEGDSIPGGLCQVHRGTLKQRARRAIEGFLSAIGRKIAGVFRR
jgi:penicillin-binding protein 1A